MLVLLRLVSGFALFAVFAKMIHLAGDHPETSGVSDGGYLALTVRVAGILAPLPPRTQNPRNPQLVAFRRSRNALGELVLSNEVTVAYTFHAPRTGGVGGVYRGTTNVAIPLLATGAVIIHDASLKWLPLSEQVRLLAAEKEAKEARRGFWEDTVTVGAAR